MTKKTLVISAFPGTGKTHIFNKNIELRKNTDLELPVILDSDSSKFSWIEPGVRHPDFPNNYIEHIKANIGVADIIFVSTHHEVRQALKDNQIKFILVYPEMILRDEYLERYRHRGNPESFIELMNNKWEEFIDDVYLDTNAVSHIILCSSEYIDSIFEMDRSYLEKFANWEVVE